MTPTELIASGYRMGRQMIQMMCEDLTADEFRHQPVPGANSAAWIVGHLAVTARRTADRVGATGLPVLTEEFIGRFSQTKQTAGIQGDLGSKEELLALLDVSIEKLIDALRTIPVEGLTGPSPTMSRFANNFGEALLFGALHLTMHCGQISTIRRSLGKPPMV